MYPSMTRYYLTLIIMLFLVSMKRADSMKMNMKRRLADSSDPEALRSLRESPYWEYILREFLFKTISPSTSGNNILYKELLEAPFYRGPFPAPGSFEDGETAEVLSRGYVYHIVQGGWIICQEGCADCEICTMQKQLVVPTVKWILRRIERHVSYPFSKRHDLQLTVLPQADGSFHMKNLSPGSYVYVTSNSKALADFTDTLIRKNKEDYSMTYPFGATISTERKNPEDISFDDKGEDIEKVVTQSPGNDNEVVIPKTQLKMTSTLIPKMHSVPGRKRGREVLQDGEIDGSEYDGEVGLKDFNHMESSTPSILFYPTVPEIDADCETGKDARLILGRDQFGEKHLVHVVPVGDLDARMNTASLYQKPVQPHPFQIEYEDRPLYRKIFRRVIDSLNTHKNVIEKFLFSSKPDARLGPKPSSISTARTFYNEEKSDFNNGEITTTETVDKSKENDNGVAIIAHSEDTSSIFKTIEDDEENSTESDHGMAQVIQESNNDHQNFDEQNSKQSLSDEVMKLGNYSETLIFKEVAKSVVNHSDTTLQGFNSVFDTSLHRDSVSPILNGTEYLNRRDKRRRHV